MTTKAAAGDANATPTQTLCCPACKSWLTVTTSKSPDVDSYWRCTKCNEVWNASRARYSERRWGR